MYSIFGTLLAVGVFAGAWLIGYPLFTMFDQIRGLGGSALQSVFRELVVPGAAGYFGNYLAATWIERSRPKAVFYMFAFILVVAAAFNLALLLPIADRIEETTASVVAATITILMGIGGAYFFARSHL